MKTTYFINISNHSSSRWSSAQLAAARLFGEVVDIPFPNIESSASADDVVALAEQYASELLSNYSSSDITVHIMGEMTFTYALVARLRKHGVRCVASTTQRIKTLMPDGSFLSEFSFQSFRNYE